ncbi:MAG: hypothetical protein AB7U18_00430, partial [Dehalococcoidia bacterium]
QGLIAVLLLNPVDVVRALAVLHLEPSMDVLGPAGAYLSARLGAGGAAAMLSAVLVAWFIIPMAGAVWIFHRQDA